MVFGVGLVVDGVLDLRASFAALPALTTLFGVGILLAGVVTLAGPDTAPLDGRLVVGERPTWVIVLLTLAGALFLVGGAFRLLAA